MIFIKELRKIFRPRMVLIAVFFACAVGLTSMMMTESETGDRVNAIYGADKEAHWTKSELSEIYRGFKWYVDTYGYQMNDETADKLRQLQFPLLEKVISERPEFADAGITDLWQLASHYERGDFIGSIDYGVWAGSEEGDDTDYLSLRDILSGKNAYTDKLIKNDKFLNNNGICSYQDYVAIMYSQSEGEIALMDEQERQQIWERVEELRRDDLYNFQPDPEIDSQREEFIRFVVVKNVLERYDQCKQGLSYFDGGHYSSGTGSSHANSAFMETDYNKQPLLGERLSQRAEALGDSYYTVRIVELFRGFNYATRIFSCMAGVAVILLILPYSVMDVRSQVLPLMYSLKSGRKTMGKQTKSVLFASFVIVSVCNIGMLLLTLNDMFVEFYNIPISSYVSLDIFWYDMDMWQYLSVYMAVSYVISAALSVIVFFLGRLCKGYISAFAACLPLIIGVAALYQGPFGWLFSLPEIIAEDWLWLGGIAAAGIACGVVMIIRNNNRRVTTDG